MKYTVTLWGKHGAEQFDANRVYTAFCETHLRDALVGRTGNRPYIIVDLDCQNVNEEFDTAMSAAKLAGAKIQSVEYDLEPLSEATP